MTILWMAIGGYSINGYWWLFYQWLLVAILSMVIGGYSIRSSLWLFIGKSILKLTNGMDLQSHLQRLFNNLKLTYKVKT